MDSKIRTIKGFAAVLTALVVLLTALPLTALAANKGDVVIVGANPSFGVSKVGSEYYGAAVDYFAELCKRTGHKYSYVEGSTEELFALLEENKIDIIPCVTMEEAEKFLGSSHAEVEERMSDYSLLTKFSAVYVYDGESGSDISFYETDKLKTADIGYLTEDHEMYFVEDQFVCTEFSEAHFIPYSTEEQLRADFVSGKIDAVVKSCFRSWGNEAIVYQFGMGDCYFLTALSDPTLASQLTSATGSVFTVIPTFVSEVYERHVARLGMQKYAYTRAEQDYIKKNPVLVVGYNKNADITELYDKTNSNVIGVTGEMLKELEKHTGLKIQVKSYNTLTECAKALSSGEVDVICGGVNTASVDSLGTYYVTAPYNRIPVVTAAKPKTVISDNPKVAMPYYSDDITAYIKQIYPAASLLPYGTVKECMDAVRNGEADIVCSAAYETVFFINGEYDDIAIRTVHSTHHVECLALSMEDATVLGAILGKGIAQVSNSAAIVSACRNMTTFTYGDMGIHSFVENYFWLIIIAVALLFAVVGVLIATMGLKARRAAQVDPLTGGRTRVKFIEDSQKLMKKTSPEKWALVLFDIDKFKFVNDRLGYEEGDRMLERLYKTIDDHLEDDEVFSRVSDDNFALTVHNLSDNELIAKVNMIFSEFQRRNALFVKYPVLFSAGVCRLGQCVERSGAVDLNSAIDRCKIAKKTMKNSHVSSIAFYDGKIRDKALREKDYENIMPTALAQKEFQCYLQPKYGLRSNHIEGAEALIRWNSKEFGFVYPDEFIPLSEKNGFVVELDFYILEEVCRTMRKWIDDGKKPIVVSVNQSRLHLNYDDYIWRLREIVDKYEIPYEYIELELTESVFTENAELLLKIMHKLHEIGFKLSLDDFGSGYSSLNMLKDIPVDVIKIDREFFNGTVNSEKGRAIISTVVDLATNLDMEVISEGVETLEQVRFLAEIKCDMVQGYYFAKPMPIEAFEVMWEKDLEMRQAEREALAAEQAARYAALHGTDDT